MSAWFRGRRERGAIAVEFVLLLPLLLLLIGMVVSGARIWWARTSVTQLAASAARQASISRTASDAIHRAERLVEMDARTSDLRCGTGGTWPSVSVNTAGFSVPVGQPAEVAVRVSCDVRLADLVLPGIPGTIPVVYEARSPLDRFRARG